MFKNDHRSGFTLVEVILYIGIFTIVTGFMVSILTTTTRIGTQESASAEVTNQLNFVMQTIQRLIRVSSNIEVQVGVSTSTLKLRMADPNKDPTCISLVGGVIKLAEGSDLANRQNCASITTDLTNDQVIVDSLNFKKIIQYPGHDTVTFDLTMTYNTLNTVSQIRRSLSSAIGRVSAATFDADVLPGGPPYNFNLGQSGTPWQNVYLSGLLNLGTAASDPVGGQNGSLYYNTGNSTFRGYRSGAWSDLGGWIPLGSNIYNANSGNVGIGISNPNAKLQVVGGDAAISTQGNGLILRATNGSNCYRITVDDSGVLATTAIACP